MEDCNYLKLPRPKPKPFLEIDAGSPRPTLAFNKSTRVMTMQGCNKREARVGDSET